MSSDEWKTKRWPFVTRFVLAPEDVHRAHYDPINMLTKEWDNSDPTGTTIM